MGVDIDWPLGVLSEGKSGARWECVNPNAAGWSPNRAAFGMFMYFVVCFYSLTLKTVPLTFMM